jgi:hypothetical protein
MNEEQRGEIFETVLDQAFESDEIKHALTRSDHDLDDPYLRRTIRRNSSLVWATSVHEENRLDETQDELDETERELRRAIERLGALR